MVYADNLVIETETFEKKLERMKQDWFIKDYPVFADVKIFIETLKNKEILQESLS